MFVIADEEVSECQLTGPSVRDASCRFAAPDSRIAVTLFHGSGFALGVIPPHPSRPSRRDDWRRTSAWSELR